MNVEKETFTKGDCIRITTSGKLLPASRIHFLARLLLTFHAEPRATPSSFQIVSALIMGDHPRYCVRSGETAGFTALERGTETYGNHDQLPGAGPGS